MTLPKMIVDIAIESTACTVANCTRTVPAGDPFVALEGLDEEDASEALCAAHAAELIDDARMRVRMHLHREHQANQTLSVAPAR